MGKGFSDKSRKAIRKIINTTCQNLEILITEHIKELKWIASHRLEIKILKNPYMTKDWYPDVQRTPTTQWKDNSFFKIEKRFKQPLHERKYALGQKAHEKGLNSNMF